MHHLVRTWGWKNATRPDADSDAVVRQLRGIGASVFVSGRPLDLIVGFRGVTMLVEVKAKPGVRGGTSKSGQRLRESQEKFIAEWKGAAPLVVTLDDCVERVIEEAHRACRAAR